MEPVYIHKLPDGTIRRHIGVPIGDGDFILVEPTAPTMQVNAAAPKKSKSYLWVYAASALAALAAGAVLWLQF